MALNRGRQTSLWNHGTGQNKGHGRIMTIMALGWVTLGAQAWGSTGELYGYGSRPSAMGNTMFGGNDASYSTFYNPAANSTRDGINLVLGSMYGHPSFRPIKGIVIQNSSTYSTNNEVVGDIENDDYNDHLGQFIGASLNAGERWRYLTLGVLAALPIDRIAYLDTGETFRPEYFNYRSRTQRPQIYGSLSLKAFDKLYLGTGLAIATNMSANATILASSTNGSVSHGRFAASIRPGVAPYFSAYVDTTPLKGALTVRLPNKYKTSLDTGAEAKTFGNAGSFSVSMNAASSIYYDPLEVDLATALQWGQSHLLTAELDWFQYKAFERPSLTFTNSPGGSISMNDSINTNPEMRNIFVPKVGYEYNGGRLSFRGGAIYRPSPVQDNAGSGNLVDPDKIIGTLGLGVDFEKCHWTSRKVRLDLHGQYHHLLTKSIVKSTGPEPAPNSSGTQRKIGAPSYSIGGKIWALGLTAALDL